MICEPIYKIDSRGQLRTWQYEIDGNRWRTVAGLSDGKKVVSGWTVCEPKSMPNAEDQAIFEANAERKKKLDRDYHLTPEGTSKPKYFKPMLAQEYKKFPGECYAQPKLDGIRCIATREGLFSRQGKKFFSCPHIEAQLAPLFEETPELILDGELYNHDLKDDFNQITSLVKKQKPTAQELAQSEDLIQYHIYDAPSLGHKPFNIRCVILEFIPAPTLGFNSIRVVDTYHVEDQETLDNLYSGWISEGYEGMMVRLNEPYEQKRSKTLLKRKDFQTEEFELVAIEEGLGNWAGFAKKATWKLPDGRTFGSGIKGNQTFTKALLKQAPDLIGTKGTVRFFEYTPEGIPRFPVAVEFARDDI